MAHPRPGPGYPLSHRDSSSEYEGSARPRLYRHVDAPHSSSESSFSSGDIEPHESASRDPDTRSRVSHHPPPSPRAASHVSRAHSHHTARSPPPPRPRPDSRQGSYRRERSRSVERVRVERREERVPYPQDDRAQHHSGHRSNSESSVASTDSSSYGSHGHGRGYYPDPRYAAPPQPAYPRARRPPEHPYDNYGPPGQALMHMPRRDPYYDHTYAAPYPPIPPPDPYAHDPYARPPPRPQRPASYYGHGYPPGYHGAELVPHYPPPQHHHYPPQPQPAPPVNIIQHPAPAPAAAAPAAASPPPREDPELRALQAQLAALKDAQAAQLAAAERERKIRAQAEIDIRNELAKQAEADKQKANEISAAEKAGKEKASKEAEEKAKKAKDEADKAAKKAKEDFDKTEAKKKELEEELKKVKGDPDAKKPPVLIKDEIIGRKFAFPWAMAKNWNSTLKLFEQAFEPWHDISRRIRELRFELLGPDKQIILPSVWETTIQPGWDVTILMPPEQPMGMGMPGQPWAMDGVWDELVGVEKGKKKKKDKHGKEKHGGDKDKKKKDKRRKSMEEMFARGGGGLEFPPGVFPAAGAGFAANQTPGMGGAGMFGVMGPGGMPMGVGGGGMGPGMMGGMGAMGGPPPPPTMGMPSMELPEEKKKRKEKEKKKKRGLFG